MRAARIALIAVGVLLCGIGGVLLLQDVAVARYPGILTWMALAIVLHDGVLSPALIAVGLGAARSRVPLSTRARHGLQGLLAVGAVLTLMAVPGFIAVARGSANSTLAVAPYALGFGAVWAALGAAALVLVLVSRRRARTK